jgi:hypothetical protein
MNRSFLLGKSVDQALQHRMVRVVQSFDSVEEVSKVKTAWVSPDAFGFQCEIDFNGRVFADRFQPKYREELVRIMATMTEEQRIEQMDEVLRCYGEVSV